MKLIQRRISDFFTKLDNTVVEIEQLMGEGEEDRGETIEERVVEAEDFSSQEMIRDTRTRRAIGDKRLSCEECDYETRSATLLTRHRETAHKDRPVESLRTMRKRLTCDHCGFKSTSDYVLKEHKRINHNVKNNEENKTKMKRRQCEVCGQKFNKDSTLNKHMRSIHGGREQL